VLLPDSSSRYLSKFLNDEWLRDAGLLGREAIEGTVADLLVGRKDTIIFASPNDPLGSVVDRMKTHGISQLPVIENDALKGVVSEVKVLESLVKGTVSMKSPVGAMASLDGVATVTKDTSLGVLTQHFAKGKIAIVLDDGKVHSLLTKIDLIAHMSGERVAS
jgi:cystathionine beta-synthase